MTTYWQIVSTSGRRWLDRITFLPGDFAIVPTRSSISDRPRGSRPVVGSSKIYNCGSWTIAWASLTFCFMPVEYSAILRYRSSSTPTNWRTSCERLIAVSRSRPLMRPMYDTRPTPVMSGMRQSCSGMYPIRSRTGMPSSMSLPRTFAVPAVGRSRLRSNRRNVVLPAPLGPTRPMAPSGILTLRSSTARTSPKTFVSPAVSTSTIFPSEFLAFRGGRSGRRCLSLDSSFAASPEEDRHEDGDRDGQHDEQQNLRRTDPGRRARAVRVRPEAHLGRRRAVLVRDALHVESYVVREVRRFIAAAGEAARNPGETPEGLIEFVRGEGARLDADVLPGEDIAVPRRREVRHVVRRPRLEERGEGGVQLDVRGEGRRGVLAYIEVERRDGCERGRRIHAEVEDERRRDAERDVRVVRGRAERFDREVRLLLPEFGGRGRERSRNLTVPRARHRERPGEESGRTTIYANGRHGCVVDQNYPRSDHVDVCESDEPEMERALARVEAGEAGQRPAEDVGPLIPGRVRGLPERPVRRRQAGDDREDHEDRHDARNAANRRFHCHTPRARYNRAINRFAGRSSFRGVPREDKRPSEWTILLRERELGDTFTHPSPHQRPLRGHRFANRIMAYDDLKEFEGETYTGVAVGGEHTWLYPNGLWRETKVAPGRWDFTFQSIKERERSAPPGSGVPVGTQYHWYILAHQRVRKIDADSYTTLMSGVKYKVAHKRPHWRKWSSEYPDQPSETEKLMHVLEETLARLRESAPEPSLASGMLMAARP